MSADDPLVEAMILLLASNIGYGIDLFTQLSVYQLEDGRFAVNALRFDPETRRSVHEWERIFLEPRDAALCFETERRRRQLGFDFEAEPDGSSETP